MVTICAIGAIGPIYTLNEFWGTDSGKFTNVNNGTFGVPLLTLVDYLAENVKPRSNIFALLIILHQKDTFRNIIFVQLSVLLFFSYIFSSSAKCA